MKKATFLFVILLCSAAYISHAQTSSTKGFEIWSGSYKFDFFNEDHSATQKGLVNISNKEFDVWTSSRKFYQFAEEAVVNNTSYQLTSNNGSEKPDSLLIQGEFINENLLQESASLMNISKINIYPNPVVDRLTISLNYSSFTDIELKLFNSIGNIVYNTEFKDKKQVLKVLDVESYSRGIYFLEISADGKKTIKKIIIK